MHEDCVERRYLALANSKGEKRRKVRIAVKEDLEIMRVKWVLRATVPNQA